MRRLIAVVATALLFQTASAQSDVGMVSPDGRYVSVVLDYSLSKSTPFLVLRSWDGIWQKNFLGSFPGVFTQDNSCFAFIKQDTLRVIRLGTDYSEQFVGLNSWKFNNEKNCNWIAFTLKKNPKVLSLINLHTGEKHEYNNITNFYFDKKGNVLLIEVNEQSKMNLQKISLNNYDLNTIWSGQGKLLDYDFDSAGKNLGFIIENKIEDKNIHSIWFYSEKAREAVMLKTSSDAEDLISTEKILRESNEEVDAKYNSILLSPNAKFLFFYAWEKPFLLEDDRPSTAFWKGISSNSNRRRIDVWSYMDPRLMPDAFIVAARRKRYLCAINIESGLINCIENDLECVVGGVQSFPTSIQLNDECVLMYKFSSAFYSNHYEIDNKSHGGYFGYSMSEFDWNNSFIFDIYLYTLKDGSKKLIKAGIKPKSANLPPSFLSPDNKFVIWYNPATETYMSYQISNGLAKDISGNAKILFTEGQGHNGTSRYYFRPNASAWLKKSESYFLITTDKYGDLWQLDFKRRHSAINLTNSTSKKKSLNLSIILRKEVYNQGDNIITSTDIHSLSYPGFYNIVIGNEEAPKCLVSQGGLYNYTSIVKAENNNCYLVKRHNLNTPPKFFLTRDFVAFSPVSSTNTDERVMIGKELLTWKGPDGTTIQGVLRKPWNFDSTKKYPVLVNFYDWTSARNNYYEPAWYDSQHNIGHYAIDTGYLFFTVAINYKTGETGRCAYNCVVSGTKFLAKKSYVNSRKIGIFGASYSGFETYYIVTHTTMFAAAFAGCGVSDMIGDYGAFPVGPRNTAETTVRGQNNLGSTPWERPDVYIKNSPIFYANRVTTPILIAHNPNDENVPFQHAVEMFRALRRLGKRPWLLVGETGHNSLSPSSSLKYFKQFFDHYLKDAPAANWMLKSIPAREQGLAKWTDLDSTGRTPRLNGIKLEQEVTTPDQVPLLKHKTRVTDDGRIGDAIDNKKLRKM
jgi:dipeptidyl aminopeptidase/acylaminoacyl peptidase